MNPLLILAGLGATFAIYASRKKNKDATLIEPSNPTPTFKNEPIKAQLLDVNTETGTIYYIQDAKNAKQTTQSSSIQPSSTQSQTTQSSSTQPSSIQSQTTQSSLIQSQTKQSSSTQPSSTQYSSSQTLKTTVSDVAVKKATSLGDKILSGAGLGSAGSLITSGQDTLKKLQSTSEVLKSATGIDLGGKLTDLTKKALPDNLSKKINSASSAIKKVDTLGSSISKLNDIWR